jgi:hypothetical protein
MRMMTARCLVAGAVLVAIGLGMPRVVTGQSTFATITGQATDATGGVVPQVEVEATHVATGITVRTQANEVGIYTLGTLREGTYVLHAAKAGFADLSVSDIVLVSGDLRRVDLVLEVAAAEETVNVAGGAGLIETDRQTISNTRSFFEFSSLPLPSPSLREYVILVPTFTRSGGTNDTFAGGTRLRQQFRVSLGGIGGENGTQTFGIGQLMNYEAFEEAKVDYVTNSAEHGRLAEMSLTLKSGTNQVRGSGLWIHQRPEFRARNPFTGGRSEAISHRYGFTVGGPVVQNRTFWFLSANYAKQPGQSDLNATVPIEAWRNGDFSALGMPIQNPFTGEVYADGRIPASAINPVSQRLQERFYPLPNVGDPDTFAAQNFRESIPTPGFWNIVPSIRVDHRISEKDSVYASFTGYFSRSRAWQSQLPTVGLRELKRTNRIFTFTHTRIFGPALLNEARVGYLYNHNPFFPPVDGLELLQDLGIQGLAPDLPDIPGLFRFGFSGLGLTTPTQGDWRDPGSLGKTPSFANTLTWLRGRHSIKTGGSLSLYSNADQAAPANLFGNVTFANTYSAVPDVSESGHPYADFLFGVPTSASRAFPPLREKTTRARWDLFVQDDWKVTPQLTLNLGLRYDYAPHWTEADGLQALFDAERGTIVVPDASLAQVSALMPTGYVDVLAASDVGLPAKTLLRTDRNNLSPRLGVAYRPFAGRTDTVVRAGFGIYYDGLAQDLTVGGVPFSISEPAFTNTSPEPTIVLPQAFPSSGTGGPTTVSLPVAANPRLQIPYSRQWNLTVEHERWSTGFRLSYIGTQGRQMWFSRNINAPPIDDRPFIDKVDERLFPQYPTINFIDNGARQDYHALSLEVRRRLKDGFSFQSTWTWARNMETRQGENPNVPLGERGPNQFVPTHRLVNYVIYELPFGQGKPWLSTAPGVVDALAGGWMISLLGILQTGQHLTPTFNMPDPVGTMFTQSSTRPPVTIRPDVLRDPNLSDPTIDRWFDADAFEAPPIGRLGNAGPGIITGPGVNVWHAGLYKYFRFRGRDRTPSVRVELTATNVFNSRQWQNPNTSISSVANVGRISGVGGPNTGSLGDQAGPRALLLTTRVEW